MCKIYHHSTQKNYALYKNMDAGLGSVVEITDGVTSERFAIASAPQWNRVLLHTELPDRYIALNYDGEWTIEGVSPERQRVYRIHFLADNYKKWKPNYPIGTVLAITTYLGNETTTQYYSLVKRLASGNYKAHELRQVEQDGKVVPTDLIARSMIDLKWYAAAKAFAAEKPGGRYTTVSNSVYRPGV